MFSAKFPARFDHLRAISVFVMDAIKESPFDERQRYAIDLAVERVVDWMEATGGLSMPD